ncbi:MAG: hypothetical protein AAFX40_14330 [Cyanobacteria bacterium J06639_1]
MRTYRPRDEAIWGAIAIAFSWIVLASFAPARAQEATPAADVPDTEISPAGSPESENAEEVTEEQGDRSESEPLESDAAAESADGAAETDEVPAEIDLDALTLIPDPRTAEQLESLFRLRVAGINDSIQRRQADLQGQLADASSNDDDIRQLQRELSNLRSERDRLAIEHLLLMRQVTEKLVFPASFGVPSPATESAPADSGSF